MGAETVRAAIYTRVSTDEQAEKGFSLEAQRKQLEAFVTAKGWALAGHYQDDGHSGRKTQRPAYLGMMADMPFWDVLVVVKLDRIHRNQRNFIEMMEKLHASGKAFASVSESLDTKTAMGRFVMDFIARLAQLESEIISERVRTGMAEKKAQGGLVGRPKKPLSDDEIVLALRLEAKGEGHRVIAREINRARGVFDMADTTRGRRKGISHATVRRVLQNLKRTKPVNGASGMSVQVGPPSEAGQGVKP